MECSRMRFLLLCLLRGLLRAHGIDRRCFHLYTSAACTPNRFSCFVQLTNSVTCFCSMSFSGDSTRICRLCLGKEVKLTRPFEDHCGTDDVLLQTIYEFTTVKVSAAQSANQY